MPIAVDFTSSQFRPLVLADCLIMLAMEADRSGYHRSASRLTVAAHAVLDEDTSASAE